MLTYLVSLFSSSLLGYFVAPKVLATLGTVLCLVLADTLFGLLLSLKNGQFTWSKLPQFMQTNFVPYVGGLLVLALFSGSNATLAALFFTIAATITVKFLADIGTKASQLFTGFQIQSPIKVTQPDPASTPLLVSPALDEQSTPITATSDKTTPVGTITQ